MVVARLSGKVHVDGCGDDFVLVVSEVEGAGGGTGNWELGTGTWKVFQLGVEEGIGVWGEAMAFTCFVVEREEERHVADGVVGDCDRHVLILRAANEVAGRCAHFLENIFLGHWQRVILSSSKETVAGVCRHFDRLSVTRVSPRIRFHEREIPQMFCEKVKG